MQKHPRQAFGIVEDGLSLSLAHIFRDSNQLYLDTIDRVRLDKTIYQEEPLEELAKEAPMEWEEQGPESINLDEIPVDLNRSYTSDPYHTLLGNHPLKWGVLALNVNDENIVRIKGAAGSKRRLRKIVRGHIDMQNYRNGNWQSSPVKINETEEVWVHQGFNRHLDQLLSYQGRNKARYYYQMADANDVVLSDHFRTLMKSTDGRVMLICLGREYRKILVFENGIWKDILPIQITQQEPEADVIYSKVSLSIDSSQYSNPDAIVLCGEMVTYEVHDYLKSQFEPVEVSLLDFPSLTVTGSSAEAYDPVTLASHALAICYALKAMNPEASYYTHVNFLPTGIIEGQKVFKIAWHGFLILILTFLSTIYFTNTLLRSVTDYNTAKLEATRLNSELAQKKQEATEIAELQAKLDQHQQNLEAIKTILKDKNPWSELLDTVNRAFNRYSISWLQSMSLESGRIKLVGTTTRRTNVLQFADMLPEAHIQKINSSSIRDVDVWEFEITADLPKVDWAGVIEEQYQKLWEERKAAGLASEQAAASESNAEQSTTISPIPTQFLLVATADQLDSSEGSAADYQAFIRAANSSNKWQYRERGQGFLQDYSNSPLAPIVRWRTAHRFYVDGEYNYATQYLNPMLRNNDQYIAHALLLAARISLAKRDGGHMQYYRRLRRDFALHPLAEVFNSDLRVLGE